MDREKFGSRKFILAMLAQSVGSFAMLIGKMGGGEYVALTIAVLGVYGAANVCSEVFKPAAHE